MTDALPEELSTEQAADMLDISVAIVWQRMERGKLPFIVVQGVRRIAIADVLRLKELEDRRRKFAAALGADTEDLEISPGCTNCYTMRMAARLHAMSVEKYRGLTRRSGTRRRRFGLLLDPHRPMTVRRIDRALIETKRGD
jgi:hypothetical protein